MMGSSLDVNTVDPLAAAWTLSREGRPLAAARLARRLHERSRAKGDQAVALTAATRLAWFCPMNGQYDAGVAYALEAAAGWRARGDPDREAKALCAQAFSLLQMGDSNALDEVVRAEALTRASSDPCAIGVTHSMLALVLVAAKQFDEAERRARLGVDYGRRSGDLVPFGRWLLNLGYVLCVRASEERKGCAEELEAAVSTLRQALATSRQAGDGWNIRLCLTNLAECMSDLRRFDEARHLLEELQAVPGENDARSRSHEMFVWGHLHAAEGSSGDSLRVLTRCLDIASTNGDTDIAAQACAKIAQARAGRKEWRQAFEAHVRFHELSMRHATEAVQRRASIAALRLEIDDVRSAAEQEKVRALYLEQRNRALAQEGERLMRATMEDALTGLMNRRKLGLAFLDLVATRTAFTIAVIDIDHFKAVNDRFSHLAGDDVLRGVADLLRRNVRGDDMSVRYGGEEFVVLSAGATIEETKRSCNRLRLAVARHDWARISPELRVTISIGIASSREAEHPDGVLALADRRLFVSKQRGRNRVTADCRHVKQAWPAPVACGE